MGKHRLFILSVLLAGVISGCVHAKNYRDTDGVLKADTRSRSGINK